ncbi:MAG: hypothetical protein ABIX01_18240 [Chitinophagaceae bacterium]
MDFFTKEAGKISISAGIIMKQEAFDKIKKTFESSPTARNNKREIDNYNKTVNELNRPQSIF